MIRIEPSSIAGERLANPPKHGIPAIIGNGTPTEIVDALRTWLNDPNGVWHSWEDDMYLLNSYVDEVEQAISKGDFGKAMLDLWSLAESMAIIGLDENESASLTEGHKAFNWLKHKIESQRKQGGLTSSKVKDVPALLKRDRAICQTWRTERGQHAVNDSIYAAMLGKKHQITGARVLNIVNKAGVRKHGTRRRAR